MNLSDECNCLACSFKSKLKTKVRVASLKFFLKVEILKLQKLFSVGIKELKC